MSWSVGQQVSVLREAGVYLIKEIHNDYLVLEDEIGFSYRYAFDVVVPRQAIHVDKISKKDQQASANSRPQKPPTIKENALPSIDLHAEELCLPAQLPAHDVLLAHLIALPGEQPEM